jgi:hypothetical protein
MKYLISTLIFLMSFFAHQLVFSQDQIPSQTVKGKIISHNSQQPLAAVSVSMPGLKKGTITDNSGNFKLKNVPVGRHSLKVTMIGYEPKNYQIVVTSGKEVVQDVEMEESYVLSKEVVVKAQRESGTAINEAALISSQEFSVDDVNRFAGSRLDPARMAQNYAGVLGANDTRNDIIIRGGSPNELLWRIDGLDVPNPNHFATQGSTGGPVSAVNSNLLTNSDFITGAFPSEYSDKMSGVFDLKTRKGNSEKYEFLGQFGFNGFELQAEGPMQIANGSFIANYRYSFLGLLEKMGINFGFSGIPNYQDATFKSDVIIDKNNTMSITGLWGTSDINILESKQKDVATGTMDILNGTDILALALNWQTLISDKMYGKLTMGLSSANYRTELDSITVNANSEVTAKDKWMIAKNSESYADVKYSLHYSPSSQHQISAGVTGRYRFYNIKENGFTINWGETELYKLSKSGNSTQVMGFLNWNWKLDESLTLNLGVNSQYLQLSGKSTVEPRASLKWSFMPGHSLNLGYGIHSQSMPLITYFENEQNQKLDFMKSAHYVVGYLWSIADDAYFKAEGYYKDITKAPVENQSSSFSLLNSGANFGRVFSEGYLVNNGTGRSYGAEISFIKNFSNGYYITATGSLVRQEYKGSDGISRWGAFDNQFIGNILAGYELKVSEDFTIEFAGKFTIAGGAPYTPIDTILSAQRNNTYWDTKNAFSKRKPNYSRLDLKIDFRQNFNGWSVISYVSVENLLNTQNVLEYMWDLKNKKVKELYQLGVFPIGGVKIEF